VRALTGWRTRATRWAATAAGRLRPVLMPGPPPRPPRQGAFTSSAHDRRVAALLGVSLGVTFTVCFATGLLSDLIQEQPAWFTWPAAPRDLYRWTQGAHLVSGVASIPLLLGKLFAVYPRLWAWPPIRGLANALERAALVPLVGGALLLLATGLMNVFSWYPTPFVFTPTHYWTAWIVVGALVIHVTAKAGTAAAALRRRPAAPAAAPARPAAAPQPAVERRRFLGTIAAAAGITGLSFLASAVSPLRSLAVLAPRRSDRAVQGLPINRSAAAAGVTRAAVGPGFRLRVTGAVARPLVLDLAALRSRAVHDADLPIACVEGWSVGARWRGVPLRALLAEAGAAPSFTGVVVRSLQRVGPYSGARLNWPHALHRDSLLALDLNGEPLDLDHGYPVRLITPNQPGVLQTKWVTEIEVIA